MWKQLALCSALAVTLTACSSKTPPPQHAMPAPTPAPEIQTYATPEPQPVPISAETLLNDPNGMLVKRSVYFDFDSSLVKDNDKPLIEAHSEFLKQHSQYRVMIQGNTDVRGSSEYNLALGQRRAESVKSMMRVLGVAEEQLEAVSYGKEKPRATGRSEADHAENRRSDFAYDKQ